MSAQADDVGPLVEKGRALLAGQLPEIQGAILADLLAIYLAGHIIPDDPAETDALRERLLDMHIIAVRSLIPVNAEHIHGKPPYDDERQTD